MGRFIIKITDEKDNKDYYLVWSTIVDAPVTYGLSFTELRGYWKEEYGRTGIEELEKHLPVLEERRISSFNITPEDLFNRNRAGKGEGCLDREGILENYCRNRTA